MAVVKFERRSCDRCGAVAELPDDGVSRQWQNVGFPDSRGFISCAEIPAQFDLCPECRRSLIQWWREKKPLGWRANTATG